MPAYTPTRLPTPGAAPANASTSRVASSLSTSTGVAAMEHERVDGDDKEPWGRLLDVIMVTSGSDGVGSETLSRSLLQVTQHRDGQPAESRHRGCHRRRTTRPAEVDQVVHLVSVFIVGVLSQAIANEPDLEWARGRFTPLFPQLMGLLPALYPPPPLQNRPHRRSPT